MLLPLWLSSRGLLAKARGVVHRLESILGIVVLDSETPRITKQAVHRPDGAARALRLTTDRRLRINVLGKRPRLRHRVMAALRRPAQEVGKRHDGFLLDRELLWCLRRKYIFVNRG